MGDVVVREAGGRGLGVFTVPALAAGEHIRDFEVAREVTAEAPLRESEGERIEHCFVAAGRLFLVGSPDCYFNHSCDPTVWQRFSDGRIEMVAYRDVPAGGELTVDYLINNGGGDSWACGCGAARCRGETCRSFFDLPVEIQREYLPLLAPWFRSQYAQKIAELEAFSAESP